MDVTRRDSVFTPVQLDSNTDILGLGLNLIRSKFTPNTHGFNTSKLRIPHLDSADWTVDCGLV